MMSILKRPLLLRSLSAAVFVLGLLPAVSRAETLILKNGKKVEGQIYDQNKYAVYMTVEGIPKTFYRYEIQEILTDEPGAGEVSGAQESEKFTEEKRELILRLLEANGTRQAIQNIFVKMASSFPEVDQAEVIKILNAEEFLNQLAELYARYYETEEIRKLILFYKSPLGQKQIQLAPTLMDETLRLTTQYLQRNLPRIPSPPSP